MTMLADILIYDKKKRPLKIFSRTRKLISLGLGMKHLGWGAYHFCSNDDPSTVAAKVIIFMWYLKGNGLPLTFQSRLLILK